MSRIVFVAEGNHTPSLFGDIIELMNMCGDSNISAPIDSFVRTDHGFRLCPNFSNIDQDYPLAVMSSAINPHEPTQNPRFFRAVDTNLMIDTLQQYDGVIFGVPLSKHTTSDYNLVSNAQYFVRNPNGTLLNIQTQEIIAKPIAIATLVSMVRVGSLPIYYIITDHNLVKVGVGFDVEDKNTHTLYRKVCDSEEYIKHVFAPHVDATVANNTVFTKKDTITCTFFDLPDNPAASLNITLTSKDVDIDTNFTYTINNGCIVFDVSDCSVGYIIIEFNAGTFFSGVHQTEKLRFEYVVHHIK